MYETGPIDDLIVIIREFIDRGCLDDPVLSAAISLLGRFTMLEEELKVRAKSWRFLEAFLSNISLKDALRCPMGYSTRDQMFSSKSILDPSLVYGSTFIGQSRRSNPKHKQRGAYKGWDHAQVSLYYSFYFGCELPSNPTSLDVLIKTVRLMAMLSESLGTSSTLEVVYKLLPTFQMPHCEMAVTEGSSLVMDNWLFLVDYSVKLGLVLCQRLSRNEKYDRMEFEKIIELTIAYALSHSKKLLSVDEMLEQVLSSSFVLFADLRSKITNLASRFLADSLSLLPFSIQNFDPLFEMFDSAIEYFLSRSQPKSVVALAYNILDINYSVNKHRFFGLFCSVINTLKNDRTMWNELLDLLASVTTDFSAGVNASVLTRTFLFPVDSGEAIKKLESIVELHFKHGSRMLYDVEESEYTQTWIYFEQWLLSKRDPVIGLYALKIFSYVSPVMSDEDFRRCSKIILSCGSFEEETVQTNMLNLTMHIFAKNLRPGSIFDDLLDGIVINSFNSLLSNPAIQDDLFELVSKMLVVADNTQFAVLLDLLFDQFKIVLQMALTDIWIMLCDSAENCYSALRLLLSTFNFCLSHSKLAGEFAKQFTGKCDISVLLQTCTDVFQNATKHSKELDKGAQIISSVLSILFSTQNFQRNRDFIRRTVNTILESASPAINLMFVHSLISESFVEDKTIELSSEYDSTHSPSSDIESLTNEFEQFILPFNNSKNPRLEMFQYGLELAKQILTNAIKTESDIGYELARLWNLLGGRELEDSQLDELISMLFWTAKSLSTKTCYRSELKRLIDSIGQFLIMKPTAENITQLLSYVYTDSECFESIMSSLERVIKHSELKPNYAIRFPQYLPTQQNNYLPYIGNRFEESGAYFIIDPTHKIFLEEGITISTWIALSQRTTNSFLHVLSLSTTKFSVSMHVNPKEDKMRVSISFNNQMVERAIFNNVFQRTDGWINVVLGSICKEDIIETVVTLGNRSRCIKYPTTPGIESETLAVSFGCVVYPTFQLTPAYELSTIFGFKGELTKGHILLLRSMGCARDSLMTCALNQIDFSFLTCLSTKLFREFSERFFANVKNYVDQLQKKLLFTINAGNPGFYGLSVVQNGPDIDKKYPNMTMLLTISQEIQINWRCPIATYSPNSLDRALYTIGHIKVFTFAYALSVDREYSAEAQCRALRTLVYALKKNPSAHQTFTELDGVSLIVRILTTENAHLTQEIFNTLASLIFSKLDYRQDGSVCSSPVTCITEPLLLNALVASVELWRGKKLVYWASLLQLVKDSLYEVEPLRSSEHDDRTFWNYKEIRDFNHHQLESNKFTETLLNALLLIIKSPENYPKCNLSSNKNNETITSIITELVEKLLEDPVSVDRLVELWSFIQLSHPPIDTHIDKNVRGRNKWIQTDYKLPKLRAEGLSKLSIFIDELCKKHSKEKIKGCINKTNSIISVRNKFIGVPPLRETVPDSNRLASIFETKPIADPIEKLNTPIQHPTTVDNWLVELRWLLLEKMAEIVLICPDATQVLHHLDQNWIQKRISANQGYALIEINWFLRIMNGTERCGLLAVNSCSNVQSATLKDTIGNLQANKELPYPLRSQVSELVWSPAWIYIVVKRTKKVPPGCIYCGCSILDDMWRARYHLSRCLSASFTSIYRLDSHHLDNIVYDKFKIFSLYALFTLLEESVKDAGMFWSVCSTLQKMFVGEGAPRLAFFEMGLTSSMVNVLRKLSLLKCESSYLNGPIFPLLDCWISFSRSIINATVPYKDKRAYEYCQNFLWLCLTADWQTGSEYPSHSSDELVLNNVEVDSSTSTDSGVLNPHPLAAAPLAIRRMLCHLLFAWVDSIQSVLSDPFNVASDSKTGEFGSTEDEYLDGFDILLPDSEWSFESVNQIELNNLAAKKQQNLIAPSTELAQRLLFGLQMINDSFIFLTPSDKISDEEEALFNLHLELLISTWQKRLDKKNEWQTVLNLCKEKSLVLLADLIAFVFFPIQQKKIECQCGGDNKLDSFTNSGDRRWMLVRRIRLARALAAELPANRNQLVELLEINLDYQHAMKIAIHELALFSHWPDVFITDLDDDLDKMLKFLLSIKIKSPLYSLTDSDLQSLSMDEKLLLQLFHDKEMEFVTSLMSKARWLRNKEEEFLESVANKADQITRDLAGIQSPLRKLALQWRKGGENKLAKASETLCDLTNQLCHPMSVFYDHNSWPRGYSLDTTENIKRERRRLKASHYNFPLKFLQESRQKEVEKSSRVLSPLDKLLEGSLSRSGIERVEANSQIRRSISVTLIRTVFECSGEIILSDKKLYFLGESSKSTQKGRYYAPVSYSWSFEQIREIQNRFYLLKDTAMELFTTTGEAFLIVFSEGKHRQMLLDHLIGLNFGNLIVDTKEQLLTATRMWRNAQITNFDYLMFLNKLAGRTYCDLMQYPVFPFILSNYSSMTLDLSSSHSFRNLSYPMPIQDRRMESFYIQNYTTLLEECNKNTDSGFLHLSPYHYGSHYSNTGIVAHFMVRVLPYTNVALEYQDNNFDIPDRLFSKLDTTWRLSSSESTTDFKELIPEFYFFPEMLKNREGLELGVRQNGQTVNDVELPPWCPENNARIFCLIHRQALESSYVTSNLHNWIDLIFGYKQQGEAAIKAVNLFHPSTYRGRDLEQKGAGDQLYLNAILTMQKTYGQMPDQLFLSPHLPHMSHGGKTVNSVEHQLIQSVRGLKWGDFVGSPETSDKLNTSPVCVFQLERWEQIDHLVPLNCDGSTVCYGMQRGTAIIAKYKTDREDILRRTFELHITAALSWTFTDRILRIKQMQSDDSLWVNLMELNSFEVSNIAFSPSNDNLYIGFTNGLIRVYLLAFKNDQKQWNIAYKSELFGHRSSITSLQISDNFHVVLSTCSDHACLWDTNSLGFVRKLGSIRQPDIKEKLKLSLISSISCDIALVYDTAFGSRVTLNTVNGDLIGQHMDNSKIMSIAITNMDEGSGINCLALGLDTGIIRLLEVWTMSTIRLISCPKFIDPVVSLLFVNNSNLYAAYSSSSNSTQNFVLCWTSSPTRKVQTNFKMLNPFL